jgi:hypothetical protein
VFNGQAVAYSTDSRDHQVALPEFPEGSELKNGSLKTLTRKLASKHYPRLVYSKNKFSARFEG